MWMLRALSMEVNDSAMTSDVGDAERLVQEWRGIFGVFWGQGPGGKTGKEGTFSHGIRQKAGSSRT